MVEWGGWGAHPISRLKGTSSHSSKWNANRGRYAWATADPLVMAQEPCGGREQHGEARDEKLVLGK